MAGVFTREGISKGKTMTDGMKQTIKQVLFDEWGIVVVIAWIYALYRAWF